MVFRGANSISRKDRCFDPILHAPTSQISCSELADSLLSKEARAISPTVCLRLFWSHLSHFSNIRTCNGVKLLWRYCLVEPLCAFFILLLVRVPPSTKQRIGHSGAYKSHKRKGLQSMVSEPRSSQQRKCAPSSDFTSGCSCRKISALCRNEDYNSWFR